MTHIMFSLIMMNPSGYYWLGSFETLEECQEVQHRMEVMPEYKGSTFACPYVKVEDT